ncbi:hypothetical protein K523DRAFT_358536, partial [Schizophyllum commune Tattone D]
VKCHYAGLTQSSIIHHAVLIAALHPKLQQQPSKLEAEASRRLQRNSPSKRITETSPSPHSTPLEAASAQLLTKSEGIEGMGHRRLPGLPPSPHDLEASSRQQRKTFVMWDTVDASSPPGKRPFVRQGWGGVGAFSPVITRLVDVEKRAISALGGLRGERDRRGEGGIRTPSRWTMKTPVGALSAQEVSSDGGSTATRNDAERPGYVASVVATTQGLQRASANIGAALKVALDSPGVGGTIPTPTSCSFEIERALADLREFGKLTAA